VVPLPHADTINEAALGRIFGGSSSSIERSNGIGE